MKNLIFFILFALTVIFCLDNLFAVWETISTLTQELIGKRLTFLAFIFSGINIILPFLNSSLKKIAYKGLFITCLFLTSLYFLISLAYFLPSDGEYFGIYLARFTISEKAHISTLPLYAKGFFSISLIFAWLTLVYKNLQKRLV